MKRHQYNQARSAGKCKTKVLISPTITFTDHVKDSVSPPVELSEPDQSPGQLHHQPSVSSPLVTEQSPPPSLSQDSSLTRSNKRKLEDFLTDDEEDNNEDNNKQDNKDNNEDHQYQAGEGEGGLEEHSYQLQSVVSHHGNKATSGHYVADVFRHDVGGWIRYDDQSVSTTNLQAVISGSNSFNGYIVTYLHKPLWRRLSRNK